MDESIESGTSVIDWTSSIVWRRIAGSSASGIPALTSSMSRTGLDLGDRVRDHRLEVARLHLLGQDLPPGRVDALADDHERAVEADHDLFGGRGKNGLCHAGSSSPLARASRSSLSSG